MSQHHDIIRYAINTIDELNIDDVEKKVLKEYFLASFHINCNFCLGFGHLSNVCTSRKKICKTFKRFGQKQVFNKLKTLLRS